MVLSFSSVHFKVDDRVFDKEHTTRSAGSCAFEDWFDVREVKGKNLIG